jgi:hypothetical protein
VFPSDQNQNKQVSLIMPNTQDYSQQEMMEKRHKWKRFLEGASAVTRLITGPLFAVGGAALIAALTTQPVVPVALGASILAVAAVSLITAVTSSHVISAIEKADAKDRERSNAKVYAKETLQEVQKNGLCMLPQKELDAIKPENITQPSAVQDKREWRQRIQTAELNEAAQRSIH